MRRYKTAQKRDYAKAYNPRGNIGGGLFQIPADIRAEYMREFAAKQKAKEKSE